MVFLILFPLVLAVAGLVTRQLSVTLILAAPANVLIAGGSIQPGYKKSYDPRSYLALAESSMAERVKKAVTELRAVGTFMFKA
jgi:fructose/tagatose bisphosphate aldolase